MITIEIDSPTFGEEEQELIDAMRRDPDFQEWQNEGSDMSFIYENITVTQEG